MNSENNIEEKSSCKDVYPWNKEIIDDDKVKLFNEKKAIDVTHCQSHAGHQIEDSTKNSDVLLPSGQGNLLRNREDHINANKQCMEVLSENEYKKGLNLLDIEPKKGIELTSLYKKRKLAKSFIYPSDLGEDFKDLNVSYKETIGDEIKVGVSDKDSNEKTIEAGMSKRLDDVCSIPVKRTDETFVPLPPESTDILHSSLSSTIINEICLKEEASDSRVAICSPVSKVTEEVHTPSVKQKKFILLSNLENKSSFEPLEPRSNEGEAFFSTINQTLYTDIKESRDIDSYHCSLRPEIITSDVPCDSEYTHDVTNVKNSPQNKKGDSIKEQEDCSCISPLKSNFHQGIERKERKSQIVHSDSEVPELKAIEDQDVQGNEGQKNHVIPYDKWPDGELFNDIHFHESDLNKSLPLEENDASFYKDMKVDTNFDVSTKGTRRGETFDKFNWTNSKSTTGFMGFTTGSGKQVKVSNNALQKAKILLELNSDQPEVSPQKLSNIKNLNGACEEINYLTGPHMATNNDNCMSNEGPLIVPQNQPNPKNNERTPKLEQNIQSKNKFNILDVSINSIQELRDVINETSCVRSNNAAISMWTSEEEMATKPSVKHSCDDTDRKTGERNVNFNRDGNVEEAKKMLGEPDLLSKNTVMCTKANNTGNKFVGFTTAAGSRVSVSKEALKKVKEKFEEDFECIKEDNTFLSIQQTGNLFDRSKRKTDVSHFASTKVFDTGSKMQVIGDNEPLKQATLQEENISKNNSENNNKPSHVIEKFLHGINEDKISAERSSLITVDQNLENDDENSEAIFGSPILGSQKRNNKEKNMNPVTAVRLNLDSVNTQEISDISDVTEAFLKDYLTSEDSTKQPSSQRKRLRELHQSNEDSLTLSKKSRKDAVLNQPENLQGSPAGEANRIISREKQEQMVKQKEKQSIRPISGSLYKLRTEKKHDRIKLQTLGRLKINRQGRENVLTVTFNNALHYRFGIQDSSLECCDECLVISGPDGSVGIEEIELGFLAMPGVQPHLVPPSWVSNHYRLIVWQLAALERRLIHRHVLTVENMVSHLKYRYDREIDRAERSILRKITEQDDIPQKTMVLCVTNVKLDSKINAGGDIKSRGTEAKLMPLLELTDGWYNIGAVVDKAMAGVIENRKVEVGTKLVVHGSEVVGATSPCHPLQASSTLRLRLYTNMTRRARWWTRLGLLPQTGPLPSLIAAVHGDGGLVGQMKVMLARVYSLYYERSLDGAAIFMGEKAHLKKVCETEKQRESVVEQITAEVEREFQQEEKEKDMKTKRRNMSHNEIRGLTLGQDIARLLDDAADPSALKEILTVHQVQLAQTWRQRHSEKLRERLHKEVTKRLAKFKKPCEVIPLLKIRIVDEKGDGALVTVWRPSAELKEYLTEGSTFLVYYLMASHFRFGSRRFTSTRQTRWKRCLKDQLIGREEFSRSVTPLCLIASKNLNPLWGEVDVVGVILRIGKPGPKYQPVYLVDHLLNIVCVNFWDGLKKCGYENSIVEGALVSLKNCSWRGYSGDYISLIHFTESSIAVLFPKDAHLIEAVDHLRTSIKDTKSLLNEGSKMLDEIFNNWTLHDKDPDRSDKNVEWKDVSIVENESLQVNNEKKTCNTKMNRQEQQGKEIQNKLRVLSHYGSPGFSSGVLSPASLQTRKPFRLPLVKPQKNNSDDEVDQHR